MPFKRKIKPSEAPKRSTRTVRAKRKRLAREEAKPRKAHWLH